MATKLVTYPYAIYYNDGNYMIHDITNEDVAKITKAMESSCEVVATSIGILVLTDVRSVIKQNPPPEKEQAESAHPDLTAEEIEWVILNRNSWKEGTLNE